tara:strand:- start:1781 stop:2005 length:225 start_codon:yes stop_codon:yes gene_type:complete
MKDKTHFFESGEGYEFESLKEKLDYFFGYFARVAKDMDESGNETTAEDYRASVELVKELVALVSEDDLTKNYNI